MKRIKKPRPIRVVLSVKELKHLAAGGGLSFTNAKGQEVQISVRAQPAQAVEADA